MHFNSESQGDSTGGPQRVLCWCFVRSIPEPGSGCASSEYACPQQRCWSYDRHRPITADLKVWVQDWSPFTEILPKFSDYDRDRKPVRSFSGGQYRLMSIVSRVLLCFLLVARHLPLIAHYCSLFAALFSLAAARFWLSLWSY